MRFCSVLIIIIFLSAMVFAQAAPAQSTSPGPPPQTAPMGHAMHRDMMQRHMQEMKAQLDSMRTKIADMKTNLAKVKDPAARQVLQADVDLWESMAGHMEAMQKMMPPPDHGPGMAMHHEGGCPCCAGMMSHDTKSGDVMGCCGSNKCMQSKPSSPAAPETPAPPAN